MGLKRGRKKIQEQAWARGMQTKEPGGPGFRPTPHPPSPLSHCGGEQKGMAELAPLLQPQGGEQGSAVRLHSGSQGCALVITGLSHSLRSITTHPSGLHLMRIPTAVDFYRPHQITLRRCKRPAWVHSPAAHGPWVLSLSCLPLGRGRCPLLSGQLQKRTSP